MIVIYNGKSCIVLVNMKLKTKWFTIFVQADINHAFKNTVVNWKIHEMTPSVPTISVPQNFTKRGGGGI